MKQAYPLCLFVKKRISTKGCCYLMNESVLHFIVCKVACYTFSFCIVSILCHCLGHMAAYNVLEIWRRTSKTVWHALVLWTYTALIKRIFFHSLRYFFLLITRCLYASQVTCKKVNQKFGKLLGSCSVHFTAGVLKQNAVTSVWPVAWPNELGLKVLCGFAILLENH